MTEEIICRFLDGTLSDEQLAEVEAQLGDQALVDRLVRGGMIHDLLLRDAGMKRGEEQARYLIATSQLDAASRRGNPCGLGGEVAYVGRANGAADGGGQPRRSPGRETPGRLNRSARILVTVGAAAVVLFAAYFGWREFPRENRLVNDVSVTPAVARFSRSVNIEWGSDARRWSVGDVVHEGDTIALTAGRAELVFDAGAVMTLLGPASMEIRSAISVALQNGTATTRVESAEGAEFRVLTPSTSVVDLGTEFGVRVEADGQTDVVVFEGQVDVQPVRNDRGEELPSRRLSIGEAVRSGASGSWERLVSVDSNAFPFGDAMFNVGAGRAPIIVGVTDDQHSPEHPKFYRIYHQGMAEEARAFVDRTYEWNGATEEGIPGFLRGADYVATFNHDKDVDCPLISVELSGPAWLYLIYDDRMIVPDWLAESFEDTGADIGLDEGAWFASKSPDSIAPNKRFLGVGPGRSIDQTCSVWRRRVEQAGAVQLGQIGRQKLPSSVPGARRTDRTMFGIAARPLVEP